MVKADRTASSAFIALWEKMCGKIEAQEASQDNVLDELASQLELINEALGIATGAAATASAAAAAANGAQGSADGGGSATARSGSAPDSTTILGTSWVLGPTINLTTVSAGNLTITGTGIVSAQLTSGSVVVGEFRVVELAGGTTIFPGVGDANVFSVSSGGLAMEPSTVASVAAFSLAESTTGPVGYRMDVRRAGGPVGGEAEVDLYFFARRS
jgi:hypothetical protein